MEETGRIIIQHTATPPPTALLSLIYLNADCGLSLNPNRISPPPQLKQSIAATLALPLTFFIFEWRLFQWLSLITSNDHNEDGVRVHNHRFALGLEPSSRV